MKYKMILKSIKLCNCGASSYSISRFDDVVNCNNCGALYYIGPDIANPVARIEYEKD